MIKLFNLFIIFLSISLYSQENCNNGIDDDGDGEIDLNDSDCACSSSSIISLIPNPSFELYTACPTFYSLPDNDQLSLAIPWIQATNATSDYHNTCGYVAPAITTLGLNTFPDGNAAAGIRFSNNWKEYLGTTLPTPLITGTSYQLKFNVASFLFTGQLVYSNNNINSFEPINITLYGCANGSNLPIATFDSPNLVDPTWEVIGNVLYQPNQIWSELNLNFTPAFNISAIMIGAPPELLPPNYDEPLNRPYFVLDNLILSTSSSFGVNIIQSGSFCNNNLILTANPTITLLPNASYQWYYNGICNYWSYKFNLFARCFRRIHN